MADLSREMLKTWAEALELDLFGVADTGDYRDVAPERNPLSIFPQARSVVVFGRSIPRSYFRGVEEGTLWMRVSRQVPPSVTYELCRAIEDRGFLAVPCTPLAPERWPDGVSVRDGKPAPNVTPDLYVAAQLAGLGEIGYNGAFLTPLFGVRQALGMLFTDAEIEPDAPFPVGGVCLREACLACVRGCPAGALSAAPTTREVGSQRIRVGTYNEKACRFCVNGAFPDSTKSDAAPNRLAAACVRACMAHLEDDGVVPHGYRSRFRRREAWGFALFEQ